jgi:ABC-2 type transport system ATP-binding protein
VSFLTFFVRSRLSIPVRPAILSNMSTPILEVRDLVKQYPGLRAVDGVSFAIAPGSCFGLLGPNGAGKTTTIEMIENTLDMTSGEVLYKGKPRSQQFREEVGIQFQSTQLLQYLTVEETLRTFHRLYTRQAPLDQIIATCQLSDILSRDNRKISGGQKQRLLLALALLNEPDLIFLDEPTTGMDPQARRNLWEIVQTIKGQGKTVILTTHYMDEAQLLCDSIAVMDKGQILTSGSPRELISRYCPYVTIQLPLSIPAERFKGLPWALETRAGGHELHASDSRAVLNALIEREIDLSNINIHSPNLEDVFLVLTGRSLRE